LEGREIKKGIKREVKEGVLWASSFEC